MNREIKSNTHIFESKKDKEFGIYTNLADLPLSECPAYLKESIGAICISGTISIQVFDTKFKIVPGMVVTLLPWQLVSIKEVSKDFQIMFFRISLTMFTDSLSSLWRLRPGFFFYMRKHIASKPETDNIQRFINYCDLLTYWAENAPQNCRRETIMQLLRVYYWTVYAIYINDPTEKNTKYTRKEEYAFQFMRLIIEEHSPSMDVVHYADKLGISPKYLTNIIKSFSGQSAHDWIVYYTLLEIKALLRESSMDLKSIAARVNFPDQSTLSRFFRHYTGMTPSKYREKIHF
ncbi:helix-turn-helix domain-containing protein [uncultured Sanguibacteroides sp.]|uniref:helix-turn-helix domain-containing protein n=1 Tax=uncultured Sanguibacteroides sp. TaxID=1635151 RepID=UPI0025D64232|nr:helix-turn-helix domain-containing protein [uncultured Sanguibacteroides sp.]